MPGGGGLEAERDLALRQAAGVDPNFPDPGERRISPEERRRRSRLRLEAIARYHATSAVTSQ
jgi:hypothetical protein